MSDSFLPKWCRATAVTEQSEFRWLPGMLIEQSSIRVRLENFDENGVWSGCYEDKGGSRPASVSPGSEPPYYWIPVLDDEKTMGLVETLDVEIPSAGLHAVSFKCNVCYWRWDALENDKRACPMCKHPHHLGSDDPTGSVAHSAERED